MIAKEIYREMEQKYGDVGSWAIWREPGDTPKSNTSDMSVFESENLTDILNPNYVFVGFSTIYTQQKKEM